jgi:16S rRNA (guanine966-N2)-methyltransferase
LNCLIKKNFGDLYLKVISGLVGGHKLKTPDKKNLSVRPTVARVRESIFNSINFNLKDSFFLDLFSGTGAIGIEALSRGANKVFFVEKNKLCVDIIKKNLETTKLISKAKIFCCEVNFAIKKIFEQQIFFDFIFMDPPYNKNYTQETLNLLSKFNLLNENGIIICETNYKENIFLDQKFDFFKTKIYNKVAVRFIKEK